jgi:hypothetical protein
LRNRFVIGAIVDRTINGTAMAVADLERNLQGGVVDTKTGGTKDAVVVAHSHGITDPGHQHEFACGNNLNFAQGFSTSMASTNSFLNTTSLSTTGITGTNSEGVSGINQNLPPYYALAFIMRIS